MMKKSTQKGLLARRAAPFLSLLLSASPCWAAVVEWNFPRLGNCHEGMAFADGVTGVRVWGGGDTINLTVGGKVEIGDAYDL